MTYLAIDIGASSGKIVKGYLDNGTIKMEVVHRFLNGPIMKDGTLIWDIDHLVQDIIEGLRKAGTADYISIDTWGVDFILIDKKGKRLGDAVSYRDNRTDRIKSWPDQTELYKRTGIQKQKFNTVYQLLSLKDEHPELLEKASSLLFIPDYIAYYLTGEMQTEYTFASTSNLINPWKRAWDYKLIGDLGLPTHLFSKLLEPGNKIGFLRKEIQQEIGYSPILLLAPSHDSASAVIGSPIDNDGLYLSSGTWSIMGTIEKNPIITEESCQANLSNEGGTDGTIRLVKNIMGTWMLQMLRKETNAGFADLEKEARESKLIGIVDAADSRFLSPSSMSEEIEAALGKHANNRGELAAVIYHSLAISYAKAVVEFEQITKRHFNSIAIVGGGSKDEFLNTLTAMYTSKEITAGPSEGTAIGNLLYQMISTGEITLAEKNGILRKSILVNHYRRI